MRRILLLPCLLLLVAGDVAAQSEKASEWKRYTVRSEEFSVMLPAHPAMSTSNPMVTRLSKPRQMRTLGAYADGLVFTVASIENSSPREPLDEYIDQEIFTHSGWDRTSEQAITLKGFKGKQYLSPNKIPGTMQIFATRQHIYRFHAFGATMEDRRVKQFFSSVVLGGRSEGIEVMDGIGTRPDLTATETEVPLREVERRPFIAMKPEPAYTKEGRHNQVTGSVILKALFTANGSIANIQTTSGLPYGLTEKAIEAARKIRFIPAMKAGKFVSTRMQVEFYFSLQ